MKFVTSLKFLVLLIVALSVFTKRVSRSKTATKVLTKLDAEAETKAFCNINGSTTIDGRWLEINTSSANSGKSGFSMRNYHSNQNFPCGYATQKIANSNNKNNYFLSYRRIQSNGAWGRENNWHQMRLFVVDFYGGAQIQMLIDKKVFGDDINSSEMAAMITNINTNRVNYMTKFRKYRDEMITKKTNASVLTSVQAKRITTKDQLKAEIANKQIEVMTTRTTLKDLNEKAEAARLQIRNYEKEQNAKTSDELDPLMVQLKGTRNMIEALKAQKKDNSNKISGVTPIDSDDLAKSNAMLKAALVSLQATYMESDPKNAEFGTLLANFDAQRDTIPSVIA